MKTDNNYISYNKRILKKLLIIMLVTILTAVLFSFSLQVKNSESLHFQEKGNASYNVLLKNNDFYESQTQNENMSYVSSLIDKINIKYNYNFLIRKKVDFEIEYDVIGKLVIEDSENKSKYYEKEYTIAQKEINKKSNVDHFTVNKDVQIDYDYYNDIANTFRSKYGISAESYLEVIFKSKRKIDNHTVTNDANISLKIPLSKRAINIKIDTNKFNDTRTEKINNKEIKIKNIFLFIVSIIGLLTDLFLITLLIIYINKTSVKKTKYEKTLAKILKEYDRFICNIKRIPNLEELTKVEVKSFQELLDVRDNVNKAIMYYEIVKRRKCMFYIIDNNEMYIYTMKEADFEEEII